MEKFASKPSIEKQLNLPRIILILIGIALLLPGTWEWLTSGPTQSKGYSTYSPQTKSQPSPPSQSFGGTYATVVFNSGTQLSNIINVGTLEECLNLKNAAVEVNRTLAQAATEGGRPASVSSVQCIKE